MASAFGRKLWSSTKRRGKQLKDEFDQTPREKTHPQRTEDEKVRPSDLIKTEVPQEAKGLPSTSQISLQTTHLEDETKLDEPSASTSLQDRLWIRAYNEVRAKNADLVGRYEKILEAEMMTESARAGNAHGSPPKLFDAATKQGQENNKRTLEAFLDNVQNEACREDKMGKLMSIVGSVRDVVGEALRYAPHGATAWGGICLLPQMMKNPADEAKAWLDGLSYVAERLHWYWSLCSDLCNESDQGTVSQEQHLALQGRFVLLYQKLLLFQMTSICAYYRDRITVLARNMMKLDDWEGALESLKSVEGQIRQDLEFYNSVKGANSIAILAAKTQEHSEKQEQRYWDDKDTACLQQLYQTDPKADLESILKTKGGLLKDSYRWILDHHDFTFFIQDEESCLLWISGDAGKGKTMLLGGIIQELEQSLELGRDQSRRLAYFFCQATRSDLDNVTSVLRGLIYTIICQRRDLICHVRSEYDTKGPNMFSSHNASKFLKDILKRILRDPRAKGLILIVDALDECTEGRSELIEFITESLSISSQSVKWIVSSRDWNEIRLELEPCEKARLQLELNQASISEAVSHYIDHEVEKLSKKWRWSKGSPTRELVLQHLTSKANDTFLWVALVCRQLESFTRTPVLSDIQSTLSRSPKGLGLLYEQMIKHIDESQDADICIEILRVVFAVKRPISSRELAAMTPPLEEMPMETLEEIIRSRNSFLTVDKGIIYFVHQSAKDYLQETTIKADRIVLQHRHLFSQSLVAMSKALRRNIFDLPTLGTPIGDAPPYDYGQLASIQYSCLYWADHFEMAYSNKDFLADRLHQDCDQILGFLKKKLLYWLESLSLLHKMAEGTRIVRKLEAVLTNIGMKELRELQDLLRDVHQFMLLHRDTLETVPLQAYASALVFTPTNSLVRKLYKEEEPDWIELKPSVAADWDPWLHTLDHGSRVGPIAFSNNNKWLASVARNINIWDVNTGTISQVLLAPANEITKLAFSPDDQYLAYISGTEVHVREICSEKLLLECAFGHEPLYGNAIMYSSDGRCFAAGLDDVGMKIVDVTNNECVYTREGEQYIGLLTFTVFTGLGNAPRLAVTHEKKGVTEIWDMHAVGCVLELKHGYAKSSAISVDGRYLAYANETPNRVEIWDLLHESHIKTIEKPDDTQKMWPIHLAFSKTGAMLGILWSRRTMTIWDREKDLLSQEIQNPRPTYGIFFSPDGQRFALTSNDGTVKIWDVAAAFEAKAPVLVHADHSLVKIAVASNGDKIATGFSSGLVKIWNAAGHCIEERLVHDSCISGLAFSPNGQCLVSAGGGGRVQRFDFKLWRTTENEKSAIQACEGNEWWFPGFLGYDIIRLSDSATVAFLYEYGYADRRVGIKTWDSVADRIVELDSGSEWWDVRSLALAPDGRRVAAYEDGAKIHIWSASTGASELRIPTDGRIGAGGESIYLAFSADSQSLAVSWGDTISVLDANTGQHKQGFRLEQSLFYASPLVMVAQDCFLTPCGKLEANADAPNVDEMKVLRLAGWARSRDGTWIEKDGVPMLLLPLKHQTRSAAIANSTMGIMNKDTGEQIIMRFR